MIPDAVAAAERLAKCGLAVFPVLSNKVPATPHGFRDAIRDPAGVAPLWRHYPGPLVGVATGAISGIAVLDIDRQHDGGAWFAPHRQQLPDTPAHRTRSGGLHLFFAIARACGAVWRGSRLALTCGLRAVASFGGPPPACRCCGKGLLRIGPIGWRSSPPPHRRPPWHHRWAHCAMSRATPRPPSGEPRNGLPARARVAGTRP